MPSEPHPSSRDSSPDVFRIAFLGDLNGGIGRAVMRTQLPALRKELHPEVVIVNGENLRNGSGISAELYAAIRSDGVDGVTLGDHVYRDRTVMPILENPDEPISRPANLSKHAPGKRVCRLEIAPWSWRAFC